MELLHRLYRDGDGVEQDSARAREWLLAAVKMKTDRSGRAALGFYCEHGLLGFPKDCERAFDCYRRAAAKSNTMGMYHMGRCYLEGVGTVPDIQVGLGWLCQAAGQIDEDLYYDVQAADLLAELYRTGRHVEVNPEREREWSAKASALRARYGLGPDAIHPYAERVLGGELRQVCPGAS